MRLAIHTVLAAVAAEDDFLPHAELLLARRVATCRDLAARVSTEQAQLGDSAQPAMARSDGSRRASKPSRIRTRASNQVTGPQAGDSVKAVP